MISNKRNEDRINTDLRNNYKQRINRIFNLYNLERDCIIIGVFIHKSVPVLSEYYSIIWNDPGGTLSGRKGSLPSMLGAISKLRQRDIKTVSFVILRKVSSCLAQKRLERSLSRNFRGWNLFSVFFFFFHFLLVLFFSLFVLTPTLMHIYICILHD